MTKLASVFIAMSLSSGACANTVDPAGQDRTEVIALSAALSALETAKLEVEGKTIVIMRVKDKIRISFLNPPSSVTYGGVTHVTFDPQRRTVVDILSEQ